ncbi:diacylglycerol kinase (ATP) [Psychromicrobium silvestre]|uniref:Diacylglycerol kinase (ATP) n=1 Tax=Psychromicrobium silvestre TaxID=1645614 RepID=A0A7Y9LSW9_9MICC|nr:YegS/Rv2252/BmrU family lipid kinase [Psychromicrobium silvestre]NYE94982.1 diacylglycerol kinase (ATP) [Psychromicrobium silvestre]
MQAGKALEIVVAVNPQAAFGSRRGAGEQVAELLRAAGHQPRLLREASYQALATQVHQALATGVDALLMVGGDGMVHLGVNALAAPGVPPTPMGVIPVGTGNDAARSLSLPLRDVPAAVERFLLGAENPQLIDLGRISSATGERYFAVSCSAGFDAKVNERANSWRWPKGRNRYNLAIARELATFRPISYRLEVDGVPEEIEAMLIATANGQSLGGGMKITPEAVMNDGELDLFVVAPMSRLRLMNLLPKVFSGTHVGAPEVSIRRVRSVRIEASNVVAYADGERIGPLPTQIDIVPGALTMWT